MSWILTRSGRKFDFQKPSPQSICIGDIAWSLAHLCRFNGHSRCFYSVAEHSVWCSMICPADPLAALLHDAAEAYVGDMTRPLKGMLAAFSDYEVLAAQAIGTALHIDPDRFDAPEVKHADLQMLAAERRDLLACGPKWELELPEPPPRLSLIGHRSTPREAYRDFLKRYYDLCDGQRDPDMTQPRCFESTWGKPASV